GRAQRCPAFTTGTKARTSRSHFAASLRRQLVLRCHRERSVRIVQRRGARAKCGGRKLSAQSTLEGFCVCADANNRGSETCCAGIARQRIPRPQTGSERRKIQRASSAKLAEISDFNRETWRN